MGVSVTALLVALVLGSIIGVLRTLPDSPWLVRFGNAWVEWFRNIPLLVQIFLWYHVLPALVPVAKGLPPFILVVMALREDHRAEIIATALLSIGVVAAGLLVHRKREAAGRVALDN